MCIIHFPKMNRVHTRKMNHPIHINEVETSAFQFSYSVGKVNYDTIPKVFEGTILNVRNE